MTHVVTPTHIDLIRPGDTVLIDGHLKTVSPQRPQTRLRGHDAVGRQLQARYGPCTASHFRNEGTLIMNTRQRIEVERKIVAFLFNTMSQHGWQVDYIFDFEAKVRRAEWTEAAVLDTVFAVDEATVSFVKATGCRGRIRRSVHIVLDNRSWDCVNDNSPSDPDNAEDDFDVVVKLVDTFAEQVQGG